MSKEKTKVGSLLQKIGKGIRFGAVEIIKGGVPFGQPIVNAIESVTGKDMATGEVKDVDWPKFAYKALGAAIVLILFFTKAITIEDVLSLLKPLF